MKRSDFAWSRQGMRMLGLSLSLLLAGVAVGRGAEPVRERIVYTALRPANTDLYLFEAPGQAPRRLTDHPALDYNPTLSPDGRWLVFCSERRGNPDLFALDLRHPERPPRLLLASDAMEDAPALSPDGQWLAYVGTSDGNADIFLMPFRPEAPEDAAPPVNLTRHAGGDFNPAFSPDGKLIAFASDRDGGRASEIYRMQVDGSELRRLTRAEGWDGSPAWSRDGETIYFYARRPGAPGLYRMAADGSGEQLLVAGDALSPTVSPAGRIAFAARQVGGWLIQSVAPDGSDRRQESDAQRDYGAPAYDPTTGRLLGHGGGDPGPGPWLESSVPGPFLVDDRQQVQLPDRLLELRAIRGAFPTLDPTGTQLAFNETFERLVIAGLDGSAQRTLFAPGSRVWRPHWSSDGKWIVCAVGPTFAGPSAIVDLWKLHPDGSGAVNLTGGKAGNSGFPAFSPDGRRIVFRSGRDGNQELYLMQADGSQVRRLTEHEATDTMPAFSPDGRQIAFSSTRDKDYELYLLDLSAEGQPGALRRLTRSPGRDTHPAFSPDGRWLVFSSQRGGLNDEEPLLTVFNPQPYGELFALRLADGLVLRLTHNKWEDGTPTWVRFPP